MGFDGFEDYESQTGILSKAFDHFAFQIRRADRPNVSALSPSYSDLLSHTGRYSVSVPSGEKVTMHKSLVEYRSNPRLNPSCADVTVIESGGCADDSENKSNAHSKTITIENTINSSITINLKATFFDEAHDCAENMKISVNNGTSLNVLSDGQSMNITIGVGETKTLTCISSVTATAGTGGYPKLNSALEFTGVDNSFNTTLTFIMCDDYYCYDPGDPSGF
ncbi:MAG: hypothetical protein HRT68_07600 [Flavobacteriaceae bacterium]|nr:hypothetical protein [Flavobacteriaceae bacterium]